MEVVGIHKKDDGFLKKGVRYESSKLECVLELLYLKILIRMENGISCELIYAVWVAV